MAPFLIKFEAPTELIEFDNTFSIFSKVLLAGAAFSVINSTLELFFVSANTKLDAAAAIWSPVFNVNCRFFAYPSEGNTKS